ncbi:hypothetical protein [Pedobacter sp.]|uniref:hypothetical protein n=1 Tax=Pedobacter sp. TaxID=1411316 RepID=UPI00396CF283
MFTNISWLDYITYVVATMIIYYIVIALKYFRDDLANAFQSKRDHLSRADFLYDDQEEQQMDEVIEPNENSFINTTDEDFADVEELIQRIKGVINNTANLNLDPEDFKQYLSLTLKEYPSIQNSALKTSVNELIVSECAKNGAVKLSDNEVAMLW